MDNNIICLKLMDVTDEILNSLKEDITYKAIAGPIVHIKMNITDSILKIPAWINNRTLTTIAIATVGITRRLNRIKDKRAAPPTRSYN